MEKEFNISYKKFSKLYFFYPILFGFLSYGMFDIVSWIVVTLMMTFISIFISKIFYKKFLLTRAVLIITDNALQTYSATGELHEIPFSEMLGPFKTEIPGIKRYRFMSSTNDDLEIIATDFTEHFDELIALIDEKMHAQTS